jgi:hypothetical protein
MMIAKGKVHEIEITSSQKIKRMRKYEVECISGCLSLVLHGLAGYLHVTTQETDAKISL